MAGLLITSIFTYSPVNNDSRSFKNSSDSSLRGFNIKATSIDKSLEAIYNVKVERKVSPEKLEKYQDG